MATIRERIARAADRAGRSPDAVVLVGAAKRQPPERLRAARSAGLEVFGENIVQEAEAHRKVVNDAEWHLIGPLQSNKAKRAVELFTTVHSIDRLKIARALDRHAGEAGVTLDCFLEVNVGEEESKSGFSPRGLSAQVAPIAELKNLQVVGLMTIPPFPEIPEDSRPWFVALRQLSDRLAERPEWPDWPGWLSMGMSADFEVAVEEGATHVRVGSELFGERS
ncbi:MAG: YggS family pyridoxal phosphate-dependent enzyme [Acidobacteriota bacterium]